MDSVLFFNGQRVAREDLEDLQTILADQIKDREITFFTKGIIQAATNITDTYPIIASATPGYLKLNPLAALDYNGEKFYIDTAVDLLRPTSGTSGILSVSGVGSFAISTTYTIVLRYATTTSSNRPHPKTGVLYPTRQLESYSVYALTSGVLSTDLILGVLTVDSGSNFTFSYTTTTYAKFNGARITDNSIPYGSLTDNSIPISKMASNSIGTTQLIDYNVTTSKLADLSVTNPKINTSAVTLDKMASNSVGASQYIDASIDASTKLVDSSVTLAKMASNSVGGTQIINASIDASVKLIDQSVSTAKLADACVTAVKILDGVVDSNKIAAATILLSNLANEIILKLNQPGDLKAFAGTTAPSGWLLCDGSAVSRTGYGALFAVIGATFGAGDGSTTFNLPDCRGRVLVGLDNLGGTAANRIPAANALGYTAGEATHTLTLAEIPSHSHTLPMSSSALTGADFVHTEATGAGNFTTSAVGSDTAHNNLQPLIAVGVCIKY